LSSTPEIEKMKRKRKFLKKNNLGDMGIGAMIVFIAMVLVAGIAATMLIQTANRLEIQSMTSGQETTREVSTGLQIIDIEGKNNGGLIADITITIRARAGSGDIDLSQTILEISNGSRKTLLTYNPTARQFNHTNDENGNIFDTGFWNMSNESFGILVLQDDDQSLSVSHPVLDRGDLVMICVNTTECFHGIGPRDDISGVISPEQGSPGIFVFCAPSSISKPLYDLY
jgi:archaeal flagellin FlaB